MATAGVVGDSGHAEGNVLPSDPLDETHPGGDVRVSLEEVPVGGFGGFGDDQVVRPTAARQDIGARRSCRSACWRATTGRF
jgi:hypothetical protein